MKIIKDSVTILLVTASLCTSVAAEKIIDEDDALRFRLKNELRRADKPSAGDARHIYAWVQGGMVDFNSRYYEDFIGVEGGAYYVYKLGARNDMSTRWYLDGHDSFGLALGAVKIKPSDNIKIKIGRFGTDYGYGSLPYNVPLIAGASNRTLPVISEGALGYWAITPNLDIWSMWRSRVFTAFDSETGVRNEGVYNVNSGYYDKRRARSFLAASWHDSVSRYSLGASLQKDVSTQVQGLLEQRYPLAEGYAVKGELLGFYARIDGKSRSATAHNQTPMVSARVSWINPKGSIFASGGYLKHAISGTAVDTDLGYPFALSIDRNKEGMQAWQLGVNYAMTPQLSFTLAPFYTHGYESHQRNVKVIGLGILGGVGYNVDSGLLKGMNIFLAADRARENRAGSALGDRLNYWDIKMSVQYDFMLK